MNSFSAYLFSKLLAQSSELSMGSSGLSAPSATVPRCVSESYNLAIDFPLYSWKMPQVGTGCSLFNGCSPGNRLSLCRWWLFPLSKVSSLYSASTLTTAPRSGHSPSRLTLSIRNLRLGSRVLSRYISKTISQDISLAAQISCLSSSGARHSSSPLEFYYVC